MSGGVSHLGERAEEQQGPQRDAGAPQRLHHDARSGEATGARCVLSAESGHCPNLVPASNLKSAKSLTSVVNCRYFTRTQWREKLTTLSFTRG